MGIDDIIFSHQTAIIQPLIAISTEWVRYNQAILQGRSLRFNQTVFYQYSNLLLDIHVNHFVHICNTSFQLYFKSNLIGSHNTPSYLMAVLNLILSSPLYFSILLTFYVNYYCSFLYCLLLSICFPHWVTKFICVCIEDVDSIIPITI